MSSMDFAKENSEVIMNSQSTFNCRASATINELKLESMFRVGTVFVHTSCTLKRKPWQYFLVTSIRFKKEYTDQDGLVGCFEYSCIGCDSDGNSLKASTFNQTWLFNRFPTDYCVIPADEVDPNKLPSQLANVYLDLVKKVSE